MTTERKSTRSHGRQAGSNGGSTAEVSEFFRRLGAEGSIAHVLALRPGGAEGAIKRIKAARAAGVEPWAALRQEIDAADALPAEEIMNIYSRKVLTERFEAVRQRLWHVQGLCGLTARAAQLESGGEPGFATEVQMALEGAAAALDDIVGMLEPDVMLRRPDEPVESSPERPS